MRIRYLLNYPNKKQNRNIYILAHITHITHKMTNITLAVSNELKEEMDKFPEINWSEVARAAIKRKIEVFIEMQKLLSKSKLTEEDAIILGRKLKKEAVKKHLQIK